MFFALSVQLVPAQNKQVEAAATLSVPDAELPQVLSLIVYGDMRFTDPSNTKVANPQARRLLAEKVASEHPDALALTGDVPYAGGQSQQMIWLHGQIEHLAKSADFVFIGMHHLPVADKQTLTRNRSQSQA